MKITYFEEKDGRILAPNGDVLNNIEIVARLNTLSEARDLLQRVLYVNDPIVEEIREWLETT